MQASIGGFPDAAVGCSYIEQVGVGRVEGNVFGTAHSPVSAAGISVGSFKIPRDRVATGSLVGSERLTNLPLLFEVRKMAIGQDAVSPYPFPSLVFDKVVVPAVGFCLVFVGEKRFQLLAAIKVVLVGLC